MNMPANDERRPTLSAGALSHRGPSCTSCADWSKGFAEGWAAGHALGHAAGRLEGATEGPVHPAVVESVARLFHGWDGLDAAHARSVARVRPAHREVTA